MKKIVAPNRPRPLASQIGPHQDRIARAQSAVTFGPSRTIRYLGIEVDDAIEIAEKIDI